MKIDYLIIGQGICGSFLSKYLMDAGASICVIDNGNKTAASKVASGVVNPVTGRIVAVTWMVDELMNYTKQAYTEAGEIAGEEIYFEKNIISFASTDQMTGAYEKRIREENPYVQSVSEVDDYKSKFEFYYPVFKINPVQLLYLHPFLHSWRSKLVENNQLIEEEFDEQFLAVNANDIQYKNITAKKIIYCNGTGAYASRYWNTLPYVLIKGEALIVDIPELDENEIYKLGTLTLVPWYDGLWWAGSSYENNFTDANPTQKFYDKTKAALASTLKISFTIKDHIASIRPGCIERRPFVGLHPQQPNVGILDGMGTKGCSLAPFFAKQFTEFLMNNIPIQSDADVKRFEKVLLREKFIKPNTTYISPS